MVDDVDPSGESDSAVAQPFSEREMDKIIRQIVDKVRGNYLENGETARGIPGEIKRIIEHNIDRV
jgi:putative IMPACT (imprinted ancient) family translation regulator